MTWSLDARLPVSFAPADDGPADDTLVNAHPGAALLVEGDRPALPGHPAERFTVPAGPTHPAGCTCCAPRSPAAQALARLFLARARGEIPWFTTVIAVASPAGHAAIRAALEHDPLASALFRPA